MSVNQLIEKIKSSPECVDFAEVIQVIDETYHFTPTHFINGQVINEPHVNQGSCKIFAFAQQHQLNQAETLACFGDFYRKDVLLHPEREDHQNIRHFMQSGWQGIQFSGQSLTAK